MKDKQKQAEYNKMYRLKNKDKLDAYYKEKSKDRVASALKWQKENKEKHLATRRIYQKTPKGRLNSTKSSARTRKIEYHLTDEEALSILNERCYYCNSSNVVGIDRMDSSKGYTLDNSVACCSMCNYMKNVYTKEMFINQCIVIAKNHNW
jgi:hypothetical protein